jgi:hypothetical protein
MTIKNTLHQALAYVQSTHLGSAEALALLGALREEIANPEDPDTFSLIFAVERSIEAGGCPFEIETAFKEYEEQRKGKPLVNSLQSP